MKFVLLIALGAALYAQPGGADPRVETARSAVANQLHQVVPQWVTAQDCPTSSE